MLAVFERVDIGLVGRILALATESTEVRLIEFQNQFAGDGAVPDASIRGSFHYLFEVKTARGSLDADQLRGHLRQFDGTAQDQILFAITPDAEIPAAASAVASEDGRLVWLNFAALDEAIGNVLEQDGALVSDRERYLLHELRLLFESDGLLAPLEDVIVVAARTAWPQYLEYGAYICLPGRPIRQGMSRMGFYTAKAIKPLFPTIRSRAVITVTDEAAAELAASGHLFANEFASLIRRLLADRHDLVGAEAGVLLLSPPDSPDTVRLDHDIVHTGSGAWTQYQRYVRSSVIEAGTALTTDQLAAKSAQ